MNRVESKLGSHLAYTNSDLVSIAKRETVTRTPFTHAFLKAQCLPLCSLLMTLLDRMQV
jgi:hypothetical protein